MTKTIAFLRMVILLVQIWLARFVIDILCQYECNHSAMLQWARIVQLSAHFRHRRCLSRMETENCYVSVPLKLFQRLLKRFVLCHVVGDMHTERKGQFLPTFLSNFDRTCLGSLLWEPIRTPPIYVSIDILYPARATHRGASFISCRNIIFSCAAWCCTCRML